MDRIEPRHIVRMFSRMTHLYGHKWASVYGAATDADGKLTASAKQWLYDLRDLTPDALAAGLESVVRKRLRWPPGPIELLDLCEGVPTVVEVLDRDHDYGPLCTAIRRRIDWWAVEGASSDRVVELATTQVERAINALRRSPEAAALFGSIPAPDPAVQAQIGTSSR